MQPVDELDVRRDVHLFQQVIDGVRVECRQIDAAHETKPLERHDDSREGWRRLIDGRAGAGDDEDPLRERQRGKLPDHMLDGSAGDVEVVDEEHDRRLQRERRYPASHTPQKIFVTQQPIQRSTGNQVGRDRSQSGDVVRNVRNAVDNDAQLVVGKTQRGFRDDTCDGMQRWTEHVVHVNRQNDGVAHDPARDLREKARLSDAGQSLDQDEPNAILDGCREVGEDQIQFGVAADERQHFRRPCRKRCHESCVGGEKARVLFQDPSLEVLHRPRGFQPELVAQCLPQPIRGSQRLCLASGLVQRDHLLRPQTFPQRLRAHQRVDIHQHFEMSPVHEICIVASLNQCKAQLV